MDRFKFEDIRPSLYFKAAEALTNLEVPDIRDHEYSDEVFTTFTAAFNDKDFIPTLCGLVEKLSSGQVTMKHDGAHPEIMGPSAKLYVTKGDKTIEVIFGPYNPPFMKPLKEK